MNEQKGELDELVYVLKLRTTGSRISLEQAKQAHAWLQSRGYRLHEKQTADGIKYFQIVTSSFSNKDYRGQKGRDERQLVGDKLRSFAFKVGSGCRHVMKDTDRSKLPFIEAGSTQYVVFW